VSTETRAGQIDKSFVGASRSFELIVALDNKFRFAASGRSDLTFCNYLPALPASSNVTEAPMTDAPALPARHANGRFGPGNPGRRAGARNRVSHRAAMAILEDFELHRGQVLELLRRSYTPAYFAILIRLLDRQLQVEAAPFEDYSDAELAQTVRLARAALNVSEIPRIALMELDGALLNRANLDPAASAHRINGD
jgi:hypothetical protein